MVRAEGFPGYRYFAGGLVQSLGGMVSWRSRADGSGCVQRFQESLVRDSRQEDDRDQYFGLSLRELIHTFKWQTLVLLKCLLLQRKVCGS